MTKLIIIDPCYTDTGLGVSCILPNPENCDLEVRKEKQLFRYDAATGTLVKKTEEESNSEDTSKLRNRFVMFKPNGLDANELDFQLVGFAGVDSGQLGIFFSDGYLSNAQNKEWYSQVCEMSLATPYYGEVEGGFIAATHGDGQFKVYNIQSNGTVVGIAIDIGGVLEPDEPEIEEDWDDDEY